VASSAIALALAELVVRIVLPQPGFTLMRVPAGLIIPHETRHFTYGPGFEGVAGDYHLNDNAITISINDLGLRDDPVSAATEVDILAIGDSFTAGWGVEASDSWPSQLEQQLNSDLTIEDKLNVVNAGVPGYGLTQMRLFLEELLTLQPKFVVVAIYTLGHGRISSPFVYRGGGIVKEYEVKKLKVVDGGLIRSPMRNQKMHERYFWFSENIRLGAYALEYLFANNYNSKKSGNTPVVTPKPVVMPSAEEDMAPVLEELGLIYQLLHSRDIPFLVLLVNDQEMDGTFRSVHNQYNKIIREYCEQYDISVFDPLSGLVTAAAGEPVFRLGGNHHWSKEAHHLVGQQLGIYMQQK
jgi:lysophospholipase L1-like esterase